MPPRKIFDKYRLEIESGGFWQLADCSQVPITCVQNHCHFSYVIIFQNSGGGGVDPRAPSLYIKPYRLETQYMFVASTPYTVGNTEGSSAEMQGTSEGTAIAQLLTSAHEGGRILAIRTEKESDAMTDDSEPSPLGGEGVKEEIDAVAGSSSRDRRKRRASVASTELIMGKDSGKRAKSTSTS